MILLDATAVALPSQLVAAQLVLLDASSWASSAMQGSMLLAVPVAGLAGLLSFFSPCVLPLLPGYLSFATGLSAAEVQEVQQGGGRRGRMLLGTSLFVLGFAVVFTCTGGLMGGIGAQLVMHQRGIERGAGLLAILLGLIFMGAVPLGQRDLRVHRLPRLGLVAAPLLGMAFGVGWTPCIGPALSVVLDLAINEGHPGRGAFLAFCYAMGLGIPFLLAGLAFSTLNRAVAVVRRHQRLVQRLGGALMVLVGLLLLTGLWDLAITSLQALVANFKTPI